MAAASSRGSCSYPAPTHSQRDPVSTWVRSWPSAHSPPSHDTYPVKAKDIVIFLVYKVLPSLSPTLLPQTHRFNQSPSWLRVFAMPVPSDRTLVPTELHCLFPWFGSKLLPQLLTQLCFYYSSSSLLVSDLYSDLFICHLPSPKDHQLPKGRDLACLVHQSPLGLAHSRCSISVR